MEIVAKISFSSQITFVIMTKEKRETLVFKYGCFTYYSTANHQVRYEPQGPFCICAQPMSECTPSLIGWAHTQNDPYRRFRHVSAAKTAISHRCWSLITSVPILWWYNASALSIRKRLVDLALVEYAVPQVIFLIYKTPSTLSQF